ncbi:MAG: ImmA/IrrE family metallo-endopeptidase [Chitinophagaceae bacterium]|nr:ImmA/IrrE family metallo-endopeptidase [Chitinophagaceae bacterium]
MAKNYSQIEKKAQELLDSLKINELPIPINEVAERAGTSVTAFDLGDDISGVLHIKNNKANIGYNPSESKVRQRFTVAHELGHYILHKHDEKDKIYVDNENYFYPLKFRTTNMKLSEQDYEEEQEANAFAAALLIPVRLVQREVKNYNGFDLSDNSMIVELAKKFDVSMQAMSYRIFRLVDAGQI